MGFLKRLQYFLISELISLMRRFLPKLSEMSAAEGLYLLVEAVGGKIVRITGETIQVFRAAEGLYLLVEAVGGKIVRICIVRNPFK